MTNFKSVVHYFKHRIPQQYRLIAFLVVTSIIGILLIFLAVYNTSKDLELIHEVDNLHRFAAASISAHNRPDELVQALSYPPAGNYQVLIFESTHASYLPKNNFPAGFPEELNELEQSRINEHGGYLDIEGQVYTWVKLPVPESNRHIVLTHKFSGSPAVRLLSIYLKRLLVPAIFYIWLMVWVALIIRFLTEKLISQNEELEQMALHDSLTGLPNRILLEDRTHKLIQDCQRNQRTLGLAVFDLNKFKTVNDTLGHDQGDELLCQVAERAGKILRTSDTFARIGGDEFVLLMNDVSEETCVRKCKTIKHALLQPYFLRQGEVTIGLSIGIAMFPEHGKNSVTLMRNADLAMYSIKSQGGGIQVYANGPGSQGLVETAVVSTPDNT